MHRELIFLPKCITDQLQAKDKRAYDSLRILLNPHSINQISEDRQYKALFRSTIDTVTEHITSILPECTENCVYRKKCSKMLDKNKDELLNKVVGIESYSLQTNLLFLIKFLNYLINWREFHEAN